VTGWLLIACLLVLGGILSTLGDVLGSRIGKARLSIFKLRPRRTAVLITIFTGSLISGISLGLILLVSRQLRVGLFELNDLQTKLQESRLALVPLKQQRKVLELRIEKGEDDLQKLENDLVALRQGQVVITSGELLVTSLINSDDSFQVQKGIEDIIRMANYNAFRRVKPAESPNRRILLVRKDHVQKLEEIITNKGQWIVNIRSAGNVLLGENYVYAFPEATLNKNIVKKGEVIAKVTLDSEEITSEIINKQLKILLSSTLAEVKRRGSMMTELKIDNNSMKSLAKELEYRNDGLVELEVVSLNKSNSAQEVKVALRINNPI